MKLSKFVKRAKSESYCVVIHADDSGIWLGTRLALYNATELPEMEGKEQVGAVLDIDSKAWEKMFFDEKYAETAGAAFGVNLTDADPLEQEARRVPMEMFYKGIKSKFVRRMQRDYPVRRRVFLEQIARPAGWKFTEIITAEDKDDLKRWRELAKEG